MRFSEKSYAGRWRPCASVRHPRPCPRCKVSTVQNKVSSASTSCRWAALAYILAAPSLFPNTPTSQLAYPATQSYGFDVVTQPIWPGQPLPCTLQHHAFLPTDQPTCQLAYPSAQL